jgi:hypothetical protein
MRSAYRAESGADVRSSRRVLVVLHDEDISAVDAWAIGARMPTRSEALRTLIMRGLKQATSAAGKQAKA